MPRKLTGVPHIGRRTETKPDGTKYIYERETMYDPVTKKVKVLRCKLIGKILPGQTEIVKTRAKKPAQPKQVAPIAAKREHVGAMDILNWAGKESGIDEDVLSALPEGDAQKAISLARYLIASNGASLPRVESWQLSHYLPYEHPLTENVYGELFKDIGLNEGWLQSYFHRRAARLEANPALALDSTTISTYSNNQSEARYGFNKDKDGLPTIKYVTLYSVKDKEPIAYCTQPGNIADVASIENALKQLSVLGTIKPMVVTDNGYYSASNIVSFLKSSIKFLTLADRTLSWIRPIVDEILPTLGRFSTTCPFDSTVQGQTKCLMQSFSFKRKRSRNGVAAGETESIEKRIYVHVFKNLETAACKSTALYEEIAEVKKRLEHEIELSERAQNVADKYLIVSRQGRGGRLHVTVNEEAFEQAKKYLGVFVLVSNAAQNCFEALRDYRLREKTEEAFGIYKGYLDGRKTRVWTGDRLRGRQFVQFIALGYHCFLQKKLKALKEALLEAPEGLTLEDEGLRNRVRIWLENRSLAQVLDWFDCVQETTVATEAGFKRWQTETTKRDRYFLRLLGVIK